MPFPGLSSTKHTFHTSMNTKLPNTIFFLFQSMNQRLQKKEGLVNPQEAKFFLKISKMNKA